jgi:hypothetical protein
MGSYGTASVEWRLEERCGVEAGGKIMTKQRAAKAEATATTGTDAVLALAEYWLSAEHKRLLTHPTKDKWARARRRHWHEFRTYHSYWLSALYVVVEGFEELGLDKKNVPEVTSEHATRLKLFRNGSFHFQKNTKKQMQFFELGDFDALDWAERLHAQLHAFFRNYLGVPLKPSGRAKLRLR